MTTPPGVDPDFAALTSKIFADRAATLAASTPLDAADPTFAAQLEALGLARLTAPESAGGSGATWREAAVVLRAAARHGIPVPALEDDLLPAGLDTEERRLRGALMRAIQITGAMDAAVDLTVKHATERTQFGRQLAAFQAVQHLIVDAAAETALATAAADAALEHAIAAQFTGDDLTLAVAIARSVCGHSASVVIRNTHQVHGAIGTTAEHPLHRLTIPILTWTNDYGTVSDWEALLARAARRAGQNGLWALISGTPSRPRP